MINIQIDGLDLIKGQSDKIKIAIEREINIALRSSAERIKDSAVSSILEGNKTGRIYKRGSVFHRASSAGQSPANDTGRLAGSIFTMSRPLESMVIAGRGLVRYARHLEFGTENMAERPFMMPAFIKNKDWILSRISKAVKMGMESK